MSIRACKAKALYLKYCKDCLSICCLHCKILTALSMYHQFEGKIKLHVHDHPKALTPRSAGVPGTPQVRHLRCTQCFAGWTGTACTPTLYFSSSCKIASLQVGLDHLLCAARLGWA